MRIMDSYEADTKLLPKKYQESLQFITMGISHTIQDNDWTTTIQSVSGPRYDGKTVTAPITPQTHTINRNKSQNFRTTGPTGPTRESTNPTPAPTGPVKDRILYVLKEMVNAGFSIEVAIGFVAGIRGESTNIDPTVLNKEGSGAYGIAQWLGNRKKKLLASPGYDTLKVQVAFLIDELKTEGIGKQFTLNAKTTEEALAAIGPFERWSYPVKLFYANSKSYQNVYNKLLAEVKAGSSPDKSFQRRIDFIQGVIDVAKEAKLLP
jgi:hypothetical protein